MAYLCLEPAPINIDTAQTAMIRVDMQTDFATKGGLFAIGEMAEKNRLERSPEWT